jgi:hypothetical protein
MQDGTIAITVNDITANLLYVAAAKLVFDHHPSETIRNGDDNLNHIIEADAASAARVVWAYYGDHDTFPQSWDEMMDEVDKDDSAQYNQQEVPNPKNWERLNFLMDART